MHMCTSVKYYVHDREETEKTVLQMVAVTFFLKSMLDHGLSSRQTRNHRLLEKSIRPTFAFYQKKKQEDQARIIPVA